MKWTRTKTKKGIEKKKIKEIERMLIPKIDEKIEHKHWSIKIEVIVKKIKAEVKEERILKEEYKRVNGEEKQ